MFKFLQKVSVFYVSKFQAAARAMKESGKQPWIEKISKGEKNQLWALYKQATEGDVKQAFKMGAEKSQQNATQQATQKAKDSTVKSSIQHDQQQFEAWSKYKGKSREEAEGEYVKLARDLLTKHKAEKYIKDF